MIPELDLPVLAEAEVAVAGAGPAGVAAALAAAWSGARVVLLEQTGCCGGMATSALIGASKVSQLDDNMGALNNLEFSPEELAAIDRAIAGGEG